MNHLNSGVYVGRARELAPILAWVLDVFDATEATAGYVRPAWRRAPHRVRTRNDQFAFARDYWPLHDEVITLDYCSDLALSVGPVGVARGAFNLSTMHIDERGAVRWSYVASPSEEERSHAPCLIHGNGGGFIKDRVDALVNATVAYRHDLARHHRGRVMRLVDPLVS